MGTQPRNLFCIVILDGSKGVIESKVLTIILMLRVNTEILWNMRDSCPRLSRLNRTFMIWTN
jgi:hypothetical protein